MLIRTYADIEKLQRNDALSPAEKTLIENCKLGEMTILGDGTRPDAPSPDRTISADLLRYLILGGCEQCQVHERGVEVAGAWIEGELDLSFVGARGALRLFCCTFEMPLAARQAKFELLTLYGSRLPAIDAEGTTITGDVVLDYLNETGKVSFSGAQIGGQLSAKCADLNGGNGPSLNAQGAAIGGDVFLDRLQSIGEVSFAGAEIGGQLSGNGAELKGEEGKSLNAQAATIGAGVFLVQLKSTGEVSFSGAKIGGQLCVNGAELHSGGGKALNVQAARITGSAFLRQLKSTGEVSFSGAEIGGQLEFYEAELTRGNGIALNGQRLNVRGGFVWRNVNAVVGVVDLNAARLGDLVDDERSWDQITSLILVGLTYEHLVFPSDLTFRKHWLKKGASPLGEFHPQPYQQLAKFYRETGHREEAREILIEKEKEQRKAVRSSIANGRGKEDSALHPYVRIFGNWLWDWATRLVAGYGYKPWLALGWLAGMVAIVAVLANLTWSAGDFAPNSAVVLTSPDWKAIADGPSANPAAEWSDTLAPGKDFETFFSLAYALDVVVPVLDLGQTDAWAPSPARGGWGWRMFYLQKLFIVLGWVVTAIAAAAISGMIRRDD